MNLVHTGADANPDAGYPVGRGQAWFAFWMTMLLMMVDYLDRQVVVSLFPYIKADWGLSDTQLGALVSIVSVTVALAALPVALLADRWSRVRSIVAMATVWSLATISCFFTRNYSQLLSARALVGLGEAGYGSVGAALIAGHFPARMRAALLAAFFAAASVGSVLGVMLGGLIAARWGWPVAFGVVGLPGLLLAIAYIKVRDYRTVALAPARTGSASVASLAVRSFLRSRTTLWVCLGAASQLIVVSAVWAWLPSFLHRFHGMAPAVAGVRAALVVLIGAAGSLVWGMVVDRAGTRHPQLKFHLMAVMCVLTMMVLCATFATTGSALPHGAQFLLIALGGFLMTCTVGPVSAIVIDVTHPGLRASGAAVLSLFQNLLGLAAGPAIAGALSDRFGLDGALTLITVFGALAAVLFLVAARSYETDVQRVGDVSEDVRAVCPA